MIAPALTRRGRGIKHEMTDARAAKYRDQLITSGQVKPEFDKDGILRIYAFDERPPMPGWMVKRLRDKYIRHGLIQ